MAVFAAVGSPAAFHMKKYEVLTAVTVNVTTCGLVDDLPTFCSVLTAEERCATL
jgi:hypothetical protein